MRFNQTVGQVVLHRYITGEVQEVRLNIEGIEGRLAANAEHQGELGVKITEIQNDTATLKGVFNQDFSTGVEVITIDENCMIRH